MKHDKQWRPNEKRKSSWAPYQRAKLKDVRPHTAIEAETICKYANNWTRHWKHYWQWKMDVDYILEEKLLQKYLNKPFADFERAWHTRTKYLRDKGFQPELDMIDTEPDVALNNAYAYYVDSQGIIRRNEDHWKFSHKIKPIKVVVNEVVEYVLRDDIYNENHPWSCEHKGLVEILRKFLKTNEFRAIVDRSISEAKFNSIKNRLSYTGINFAIHEYCKRYDEAHWLGGRHYSARCPYNRFDDMFVKDTSKSTYRYIEPGTKEFRRYYAESDKQRKMEYKRNRRLKRQAEETLLQEIEASRKARVYYENSQKIVKHGFSETESFRGEEYHGQKRKRKQRHADVVNHEMFLALQDTIEKTW